MTYTMIQPGECTGGGLMKQPSPGAPSAWLAYVDVDDVKASTEKARSLGAQVMRGVTEVPQMGWFSIIVDPTGAMMAAVSRRRSVGAAGTASVSSSRRMCRNRKAAVSTQ